MTDWTETYYGNNARLLYGINVLSGLQMLPEKSVQCIVTSPPYWGLRNYNTTPQIWPSIQNPFSIHGEGAGDGVCNHQWQITDPRRRRSSTDVVNMDSKQATSVGTLHDLIPANLCTLCGAWQGELGQEPTPDLFIEHLVLIFRECKRVLRKDGILWVNIGDTYTANPPSPFMGKGLGDGVCKPKELVGIPWLLAFAMRKDGWWIRQENIWAKPNCMPESVTDRTTRSHESVFMFTQQKDYFYDHQAVKTERATDENRPDGCERQAGYDSKYNRIAAKISGKRSEKQRGHPRRHDGFNDRWDTMSKEEQQQNGANLRSVWWITPAQYRESHYATYPVTLPEICILASTSEGGCCPKCGTCYEREIEVIGRQVTEAMRVAGCDSDGGYSGEAQKDYESAKAQNASDTKRRILESMSNITRSRFVPNCACNAGPPTSCTILDPFMGSGTTAEAALTNNRHVIGIDLDPKNLDMAIRRIKKAVARDERTINLI